MPRRDTWTNLPSSFWDPSSAWIVVLLRDVVLQMPTIGFASAFPALARSVFGTWSARVFTLKPASVSSPTSVRFAPYRRSNTRRSRKNASSDWPAQVLLGAEPKLTVAAENRSPL